MTSRYTFQVEAPVAASAVGIFFSFALYFSIKKGCLRKKQFKGDVSSSKVRKYQLDVLKKATDSFSDERLIGSGAFGDVYRGVLDDEKRTVAVKRANSKTNENLEEFKNEIDLLSRVKHKNLVGLAGYCAEDGHMILVYEYVPHGSLLEYIVGKKRRPLTWQERVTVAIGSARGIAHLHEFEPSIIHRDLKPSNILIDDGFEAKISDFGLVKLGPDGDASHVSTQVKGTPGYMDPAYCSSLHLTASSDVYSFGVILLQLVSASPALDHMRKQSQYHITNWAKPSIERGRVEEILDSRLQFEACNMNVMLKMAQLGIRCTAWEPKDRPTMSQVVEELEEALKHAMKSVQRSYSEDSRSISINSIQLQRFYVESFRDLSFKSTNMMCLDADKSECNIEEIDGR